MSTAKNFGRCQATTARGWRCSRIARTMIGHGRFCLPHARQGWTGALDRIYRRTKP